ncbi:hypothetical protein ACP70R_040987 [Stipagrostis hirtigluma subsp. patula]
MSTGRMAPEVTATRSEPSPNLIRVRSPADWVVELDLDAASPEPGTPTFLRPVAVPFLWEEAPGKPRRGDAAVSARPVAAASPALAGRSVTAAGRGVTATAGGEARARPRPLKLPPRLQATSAAEYTLSLNTVLQSPDGCGGGKRPPTPLRRSGSATSFRRTPSAGGRLFAWSQPAAVAPGIKEGGHDHHDAFGCSPAATSPASSSSSSSFSCFGDDYGHGAYRRPPAGDGGEDSEYEKGAKRLVRMPGLRRNKSVPSMNTSHIWASIRRGVKRITPWI